MMTKWDKRFLELAHHISSYSKDPSTKVGAVLARGNLLVSIGFNGFPHGVNDEEGLLYNREEKYKRIIHAEPNAILSAKQDVSDCTLYVSPLPPCSKCSLLIIQSGIKRIITYKLSKDLEKRWGEDITLSHSLFLQAGVEVIETHK